MRRWPVLLSAFLFACGDEPAENMTVSVSGDATKTEAAPNAERVEAADTAAHASFRPPLVQNPSGIYQCFLPSGKKGILHTVAFYPGTFRLQEEYSDHPDSVVITTGTWAPSQGYIWLYKDQVVRGRYKWRGDTLQYYSPRLKKHFALQRLTPAKQNKAWQERHKAGVQLFGTGTEPFWSVEVSKQDSLTVNMPDWPQPLRTKISTAKDGDHTTYTSSTDSLTLTVFPYFCSDGMSDFIYTRKLVLNLRGKTYSGCGELF